MLGHRTQKLNALQTYSMVFKGFVATGILYLPKAFVAGGWLFTSCAMAIAAVLSAHCATLLLIARTKTGAKSYSELGAITMGMPGKVLVDCVIAVSQITQTIAYIYFILSTVTPILFPP